MGRGAAGENAWEKKLNIRTGAADYEREDANHSRYEPTAYAVLERLADSGHIRRGNTVVDYGCGKGRVGFFLNYVLGCRTIGVEFNETLYRCAMENLFAYSHRNTDPKPEFVCFNAENYPVQDADCFYFFNPFSEKILHSVISRILESYYVQPRPMKLFFYYAVDEYLAQLMTEDMLYFAGEIDCRDLFHNDDPRERILVFGVG